MESGIAVETPVGKRLPQGAGRSALGPKHQRKRPLCGATALDFTCQSYSIHRNLQYERLVVPTVAIDTVTPIDTVKLRNDIRTRLDEERLLPHGNTQPKARSSDEQEPR